MSSCLLYHNKYTYFDQNLGLSYYHNLPPKLLWNPS